MMEEVALPVGPVAAAGLTAVPERRSAVPGGLLISVLAVVAAAVELILRSLGMKRTAGQAAIIRQ
jgi:hypothetical protein